MILYQPNDTLSIFNDNTTEAGPDLKRLKFQYDDCPCGEEKYKIISLASRHNEPLTVVNCLRCGTLRVNPYMDEESASFYYKKIYGRIKRKGISPEELYKKQALTSSRLKEALKPLGLDSSAQILDFGGGAGGRLDSLLRAGFKNLSIQDHDNNHLSFALEKGIKSFDEGSRYDLLILSHVYEHLTTPVLFIKDFLKNNLSDQGYIYIEVPFIENQPQTYLLKDLHLAHKFYFNSLSLEYILTKNHPLRVTSRGRNYIIFQKAKETTSKKGSSCRKMRHLTRITILKSHITKLLFFPYKFFKKIK